MRNLFTVSILLLVCYTTPAVSKQCTDLVSADTCHKIGQMLVVGFGGHASDQSGNVIFDDANSSTFTPDSKIGHAIRDLHVGGVILYSHTYRDKKTEQYIRDRNIQGPKQLAQLNLDLKNYSNKMRRTQKLPALPLWIAIDQEGGIIDRLTDERHFRLPQYLPRALGEQQERAVTTVAKQHAPKHTYTLAQQTAKVLKQEHIDINFAPVVDVNINPSCPIVGALGRSFSHDPLIVAEQAQQTIKGFHSQGIIAAIKHFPGHGSADADTHLGLTDITDTYQRENELIPYQRLIKHGYHDLVMTSHVINGQFDQSQCIPGEKQDHHTWCPATLSYKTLTELLRNKLGFSGVIISDDITMDAIAKQYPLATTLEKAINAGVDMFIVGNHHFDQTEKVVLAIAELVHTKKVSEERINQAFGRIITLKHQKSA